MRHLFSIELLEDRIAPATLVNPTTITYTDTDGDSVVLKISKPLFTSSTVANDVLTFDFGTVNNSNSINQQLQTIDLTQLPGAGGMNLSVTVQPRLGVGNHKVNVGYIKAANIDADIFQFFDNIDLGVVTIDGDLGQIDVGDPFVTPALKALNVESMGKSLLSGASSLTSNILGPVTSFHATGDVENVRLKVLGGAAGNIGTLAIDGSLIGASASNPLLSGTLSNTGQIFFTGKLGKATIGNIVGGDFQLSGTVRGTLDSPLNTTISNLHVIGSITGGVGGNSGAVIAAHVKTVAVDGDVVGGSGAGSGLIFGSKTLGDATVNGSLLGGSASESGEIFGNASIKSVVVGGSIVGGSGGQSGHVSTNGPLGTLTIGVNLKGGAGEESGAVIVGGTLTSATIGGDIIGGNSGVITQLNASGYLQAGKISQLTAHSILAGTNGGAGIADSGAVRSESTIGSLLLTGGLIGNAGNNAIISAVGVANPSASAKSNVAIGSITILGNMDRAEILAGYGPDTTAGARGAALNPDAQIGPITIAGDLTASSIVAGVSPGANGKFGDSDDVKISPSLSFLDLPGIVSKISSVVVTGANGASGTAADDTQNFGIVAQEVALVNVKGIPLALTPGAANDLSPGVVIGATPGTGTTDGKDFHALEVSL